MQVYHILVVSEFFILRMEVNKPGLERMVVYDFISVLKYLNMKDKMCLRAVNTNLHSRINQLEDTFKVWSVGNVNSAKLMRVADEIQIIEDLTLKLSSNDVGLAFVHLIENHPEIHTLVLSLHVQGALQSDFILLSIFSCMDQLKYLHIRNLPGKGELLESVHISSSLKNLLLSNCNHLSNKGFTLILRNFCSGLKLLILHRVSVSTLRVKKGEKVLPMIEKLVLNECFNLNDARLSEILAACGTQIKELRIIKSGQIKDMIVKRDLKISFPSLEILKIKKCVNMTENGLHNILRMSGSELIELSLFGMMINGKEFDGKVKSFPKLKFLNLKNCENVDDAGLSQILASCGTSLEELNLRNLKKIKNINGKHDLKISFPCLEMLCLDGCSNITDKGLYNILRMCGGELTEFYLVGSSFIRGQNFMQEVKPFPKLEILDMHSCGYVTHENLHEMFNVLGGSIRELHLSSGTVDLLCLDGCLKSLSKLEILHLENCLMIRPSRFQQVFDMVGTRVKTLYISTVYSNFSSEFEEKMRLTYPQLELTVSRLEEDPWKDFP